MTKKPRIKLSRFIKGIRAYEYEAFQDERLQVKVSALGDTLKDVQIDIRYDIR